MDLYEEGRRLRMRLFRVSSLPFRPITNLERFWGRHVDANVVDSVNTVSSDKPNLILRYSITDHRFKEVVHA